MGSIPIQDIKSQKEFKEKDFKDFKEKDLKDFKEKDFKDFKEKDFKDFKEKDFKEFKEKEFKELKEKDKDFEGPVEQLPLAPPVRGPDVLGDMLRRIERLEKQMGLGEPFISKEERPSVGEGALRQPKDEQPGNP